MFVLVFVDRIDCGQQILSTKLLKNWCFRTAFGDNHLSLQFSVLWGCWERDAFLTNIDYLARTSRRGN